MWYTIGHMFDGNKLRQLRQDAGLTQLDLAVAAGMQPQTVNRLEAGKNPHPRVSTAAALAQVLGVTIEDLLTD